jgi:broad specificity phosphatase PhoE
MRAPTVTRILVVRHGQSEWNALGRWQGHADPDLSPLGAAQARAAADALGAFDAVVASDLRRARHTAELLAAELGIAPVLSDPRFRETDAGEWQGLTRDEIDRHWPGYLDEGRRPPGFEPYDRAAERLAAALIDVGAAWPGGEVLGVSHGGVIRALRHRLGAPLERLANLAGAWFHVRAPHGGAPGRIEPGAPVRLLDLVDVAVLE